MKKRRIIALVVAIMMFTIVLAGSSLAKSVAGIDIYRIYLSAAENQLVAASELA